MCGAPTQDETLDRTLPASVDPATAAIIQGQVLRVDAAGQQVPVENAYVRLLDRTGEFTAEVPTNEDGTFKSDDELAKLYAEAGLDNGKDTIAYCRIGERSSHTWFVLKELLGKENVKNYDGSWTEYGSLIGVPIALGDEPGKA